MDPLTMMLLLNGGNFLKEQMTSSAPAPAPPTSGGSTQNPYISRDNMSAAKAFMPQGSTGGGMGAKDYMQMGNMLFNALNQPAPSAYAPASTSTPVSRRRGR